MDKDAHGIPMPNNSCGSMGQAAAILTSQLRSNLSPPSALIPPYDTASFFDFIADVLYAIIVLPALHTALAP
jgi:hypothetical protein